MSTDDLDRIAAATRLAFPADVVPGTRLQPQAPRPSLGHAIELVLAQIPVVRRNLWAASAIVMGVGFAVTLATPRGGAGGGVFAALTPLIAAAGVSFVYGPDNDPPLEIALATPTSPRAVLLARLVLVTGYDLGLALFASILLALIGQTAGGLEAVILMWLGPMLLLSALSLAMAVRFGTAAALGTAAAIWLLNLTSSRVVEHLVTRLGGVDPLTGTAFAAGIALLIFALVVVRLPGELKPV